MVDVNEIRTPQIELFDLIGADDTYTFYHDETNNIRKLHINGGHLNIVELKTFVLGGVVHRGLSHPINIEELRQAMKIQKSANEIKLKHVAKGDFLDLLDSPKLTIFLKWLSDNELMIHYHELDPLYWSIVDIIDSILPFLDMLELFQYHALLKSDLNEVIRSDLTFAIDLFHRCEYPGMAPENKGPFLDALITLIERDNSIIPEFNANLLKSILEAGKKLEELEFIQGFPCHQLIASFSDFYRNRVAVFKYATHIMDMESDIQDVFLDIPLTNNGEPFVNYRFADSTDEAGIQISDIIVGVLGKMHTYLSDTPKDKVDRDRSALIGNSAQNAELLRDLIETSDKANKAFLQRWSYFVGQVSGKVKLQFIG